ncbi:hypothetical protein ABZ714_25810 [Streptomyces sp. NPDC006798]|uniref:hypothetical protein n=1 Tax=Streptomyces sp. NPDC006798 TaxID=3155462 RepID=UPI003400F2F4
MADVFEPETGDGPAGSGANTEVTRAAEVRTAYAGLLQIRRLGGAVPAAWERNQPVRAVALTLEAAGLPPSAVGPSGERAATGYRVSAGPRPGTARVEWLGPPGSGARNEAGTRLRACVSALEAAGGWDALLYRGERGLRFVEVEPLD